MHYCWCFYFTDSYTLQLWLRSKLHFLHRKKTIVIQRKLSFNPAMKVYILMGVSGCGKSTIGREAAKRLNIPFLEGDDFHPKSNIEKMSNGLALYDDDRMPWVDVMVQACKSSSPTEGKQAVIILACSALSKRVRQRLRNGLNDKCRFIHLHGDKEKIKQRLSERKGHFFKAELLASQFDTLDIPQDADRLDIFLPIDILAAKVCDIIQSENQT
jgi:gluconokinase